MKNTEIPAPDMTVLMEGQIFSHQDISDVVHNFYPRVQRDPVLGEPFKVVEDWPMHMEGLVHFWWTRLGGRAYLDRQLSPVPKHFKAGFNDVFLKRWLELFKEVMETTLTPGQVSVWFPISEQMGDHLKNLHQKYAAQQSK